MVKLVKIHVRQELACQRTQGKAAPALDAAALRYQNAEHMEHVRVADGSGHHAQKYFMVDTVKVFFHVGLQRVHGAAFGRGFPEHGRQIVAGSVRPLVDAAGETLRDEAALEIRADDLHQRMMHHAVRKEGRMNQAAFRFKDEKLPVLSRLPCLCPKEPPELKQVFLQARIEGHDLIAVPLAPRGFLCRAQQVFPLQHVLPYMAGCFRHVFPRKPRAAFVAYRPRGVPVVSLIRTREETLPFCLLFRPGGRDRRASDEREARAGRKPTFLLRLLR